MLSRRLSQFAGFRVLGVAENGVRAVEIARELRPHVLVLDISMPYKNGIEVLRELRAEDRKILIIMFTSEQASQMQTFCLELGADHYLDKFQVQELIKICRSYRPLTCSTERP